MVIESLGYLYVPFFYIESSEEVPVAIMPYLIKCFLEINEIMDQVTLVLQILPNEEPTIEDLFHCAALKPACSSESRSSVLNFRDLMII